ncbi:ABC transporter ATP-binding protein [Helicobacter sp. 11S02596-1]|uniref:ABC transporter ATP-binding protein/permease n=1 Tax=Helicobacter sp. 11S02596-1 TaxID=1476194 RepID=UPI000BCE281C|nr:ABC transporter ATP-binding protein [Helicobacter sp. 11S02596-1]PAF45071.1 multidrug transporter [Helicobacter sp. 11S02596-1]
MVSKTKMKKSIFFGSIKKFRQLINRRDKIIIIFLLIATILLSVIETFGISIIMPFITFASTPDMIFQNKISKFIYDFFGFGSTLSFMLTFSFGLIVFYIFRAFYNIGYTYAINRFAFRKYHYFSYKLFCKNMDLTYLEFTNKNADKIRSAIVSECLVVANSINHILIIVSEIFTVLLLYVLLLLVSWKMTIVLSVILGIKILFITKWLSKVIKNQGDIRVQMEERFFKILSKNLGNFKIIKLKGNEENVYEAFDDTGKKRANAQTIYQVVGQIPKNILETVGFGILIGSVAYVLYQYNDASAVLPIISMYALALYRILPSINKIMQSYSFVAFCQKSLDVIYSELTYKNQEEGNEKLDFNDSITLKNITFGYTPQKPIIKDFNLTIQKGEKIAFIGPSGAGKSTLIDVIIGIYEPDSGEITIDKTKLTNKNIKTWRKKIGYIPQSIYLFDGSVAENVAFGSKIDKDRLIWACKMANIYDFLMEKDGLDTLVGDGGIKLSGGQKQRVGIARAIYDNPEILVLDEATSALDTDTETKIMDEIYKIAKDKTLLVIAHRLSTIERCERKIKIG